MACQVECTGPSQHFAVADPSTNHCYLVTDGTKADHWGAADAFCQGWGGYLVTIGSDAENTFVYDQTNLLVGNPLSFWIGMSDILADGTFEWSSGEPVGSTNWATGRPSDTLGCDAAVLGNDTGTWTTQFCENSNFYVCERWPGLPP